MNDWSYNLKSFAWHYDPTSLALQPPNDKVLEPLYTHFTPLRQQTLCQLEPDKILACIEESVRDFLVLIAPVKKEWITDLSDYTRHGLLMFGAVVDHNKPGILAHLPSTPPPEWFCYSHSPDVKATLSTLGMSVCGIYLPFS